MITQVVVFNDRPAGSAGDTEHESMVPAESVTVIGEIEVPAVSVRLEGLKLISGGIACKLFGKAAVGTV